MKKLSLLLVFALSLVLDARAVDLTYDWGTPDTIACHMVGPGMKYTKIIYHDKPLILWNVEVDLTNPHAKIEQVQSRHAVPDDKRWDVMTHYRENSREGHQVRVAWNHDFFMYDPGVCIGLNVSEGEVTWNKWGRSLLAITDDKKAEVFYPDLDAHVSAEDGTSVDIDYYNSRTDAVNGDCILFNRLSSRDITEDGLYVSLSPLSEWRVNGQPTRCLIKDISTSPISTSNGNYVLFLRGDKRTTLESHLQTGKTLLVTQQFRSTGWGTAPQRILNAFHGYPSIVHDGVLHEGEFNNFENGREYEKSSRVMAGISKDKTKLYIVTTEMSASSVGVDCIELSAWLVEHGAWDVVNFDSGGSAAIVIDEQMLNLPGRGSVRPVEDAMLAVSTAPTDNNVDHMTFSIPALTTSVLARVPLRVMSFNQYDEPLEQDVQDCDFMCLPPSIGHVDSEGIFHSSTTAGTGRILAIKDGRTAEMVITTNDIDNVVATRTSLLVDGYSHLIPGIYTKTPTGDIALDPAGFDWVVEPEGIVEISPSGMIKGIANGTAKLTATFKESSISIDVTAELVNKLRRVVNFADISDLKVTKSSAVKNLTYEQSKTFAGSQYLNGSTGLSFKFDLTPGRGTNIKLTLNKRLYGIPDSLRLDLYPSNYITMPDEDVIVSKVMLLLSDVDGKSISVTREYPDHYGFVDYYFDLLENGEHIEYYRYPLTLKSATIYLESKTKSDATLDVSPIYGFYHFFTGVEDVTVDDTAEPRLDVALDGEVLHLKFDAANAGVADVAVHSIDGRHVLGQKVDCTVGNNVADIDIKALSRGVYVVSLNGSGQHAAAKFIVR